VIEILEKITSVPPIRRPFAESERIERLIDHLNRRYQVSRSDIRIARVPLRICPLGAHIDHQLGIVTGTSIDRTVLLAFAPTTDGAVQMDSLNYEGHAAFAIDDVPPLIQDDWANYARGAVLALQNVYGLRNGLVGVIESGMPVGGLSSSAAVTVAYLLALESVNGLDVDPATNVSLVSQTEHGYIGLRNGILDQTVILFSEHNQLTRIDCADFEIDQIPTPLTDNDYEILVVYSGMTRGLVGSGYNTRVVECQEAARQLLGFAGEEIGPDPRLRHVDPEYYDAYGHRLPNLLGKRAAHYFGEMQRVSDGISAWTRGDLAELGRLVSESGGSSVSNYECGSPQLISLYEILNETPGVHGARFSGAGFRGSCIALVEPGRREAIAEAVHARYPALHPDDAQRYSIHFCRPDGCAQLIDSGV